MIKLFPNDKENNIGKAIVMIVIMTLWLLLLLNTKAYFFWFAVIYVAGLFSLLVNLRNNSLQLRSNHTEEAISLVFSLSIALANYDVLYIPMFETFPSVIRLAVKACGIIVLCLGGWICSYQILLLVKSNINAGMALQEKEISPEKVFWISFVLIATVNLLVLFLARFPGTLSYDSINQIKQIETGIYDNWNPLADTFFVGLFYKLGKLLFNNNNAAIAFYMVCQILFMSTAFAYAMKLSCKQKVSAIAMIIELMIYTLTPYHIVYSSTLWKDVLFSGCVTLFSLFGYEIILGNDKNRLGFILSGIGVCIFRNNGILAFIILFIAALLLKWFNTKKLASWMLIILIVGGIIRFVPSAVLQLEKPDIVETVGALPAQQVARVVSDNKELNDYDRALLEKIMDFDRVKNEYNTKTVDSIKFIIRDAGGSEVLAENINEYMRLYFRLMFKYPITYMKAAIDLTKGYWSFGGYDFWNISSEIVHDNDFGIKNIVGCELFSKLTEKYIWWFNDAMPVKLFRSIGVVTWLLVLIVYICKKRNDKALMFIPLLALCVTLTLCMGAPVFAEFRYAYSMFCVAPVATMICFRKN